jgi:hypothetical protein
VRRSRRLKLMDNQEKIELIKPYSLFKVDTYNTQLSFFHDTGLAKNVAYNLHFLEFLRQMWLGTNVKHSIEKSIFKTKIITLGSIMEAIIHDALKFKIASGEIKFEKQWKRTDKDISWLYSDAKDSTEKRFSAAIEELVDEKFSDRSDLAWLINLAGTNNIIKEPLLSQCHRLREYRNTVHTKLLDQWEMFYYTAEKVDNAKECVRNLFTLFYPDHNKSFLYMLYSSTVADKLKK